MEKKEFYRKNLPHLQIQGQSFFVTWLLAGVSLNTELSDSKTRIKRKSRQINEKPNNMSKDLKQASYQNFLKYDKKLDNLKSGNHFMKIPEVSQIVADSIHYWDNKRIDLFCYCIMSNHVHAVFTVFENDETGSPLYLQDMMKSIKGFSARECNKLLKRKGQFWQHESYDRLIRNRKELYRTISYVLDNPTKARLCKERKDWKWSFIKPKYNEFM